MESQEEDTHTQHDEGIDQPLLVKSHANSIGGFTTLPFIIGSLGLATIAYWGADANMIIYITKEYGMEVANGSNIINLWEAITNFTPILGAFLADSYVGRFPMIGFGSIIVTLGMLLFWSTTIIPGAKPSCDHTLIINNCTPIKPLHLFILYSSFTLIAIGMGAHRASGLAFGADQLRAKQQNRSLEKYFNWYFITIFSCIVFAFTFIVYIEDHMGWVIGFGIPVLLLILSTLIFFLGTSFYYKSDPKTNLLTSLAQVVVASWRNRHYDTSSQGNIERRYHVAKGSRLNMPSDKLKFLNKACVIKDATQSPTLEGFVVDSWSLCTIDQVEELKSLINIIPLWSTGIIFSLNFSQTSFRVIQANSMDRHVFTSSFEIPAASLSIFSILTAVLWLALYDSMFLPLASKIMNKPIHLNVKTRMGLGLVTSIMSLSISAIVESIRLKMAINDEELTRPMSALWLLPQICLIGLAEGCMITAQNEFFYSELPKSMSSIASNLYTLGMSIGGFVASLIVSVVDNVTGRDGKEGWLSNDPNKGHYDYYYGVLVGFCLLNFIYFLVCSRAYDNGRRICNDETKIGDRN